ncbi:unnamed protein product [Effrenium voratum]|uniref:Uncharacterized protein n=1 Tax=Effrenium voratum TaxID=2562239 RepID=A0AA36JP54_9DINO|nr:unnamed protein product [Effrenium voratum]CAJ1409166.1 unnamed protein product [Effrenium voratum]CAJ1461460.1 unnamed protein product [Effrenium voratum]
MAMEQDRAARLHLARNFCVEDGYAKRAFDAACKTQGTMERMTETYLSKAIILNSSEMKKNDHDVWIQTVRAFRDKKATQGKAAQFDVLSHAVSLRKSRVDMQEVVIKPMLMGEFRHKKQLAPPFNLSEAEALSEWHRLIGDPSVNKSEKVLFNPKSRKEETFTRVHVIMEENERRQQVRARDETTTQEASARHPTASFRQAVAERFAQEDSAWFCFSSFYSFHFCLQCCQRAPAMAHLQFPPRNHRLTQVS